MPADSQRLHFCRSSLIDLRNILQKRLHRRLRRIAHARKGRCILPKLRVKFLQAGAHLLNGIRKLLQRCRARRVYLYRNLLIFQAVYVRNKLIKLCTQNLYLNLYCVFIIYHSYITPSP